MKTLGGFGNVSVGSLVEQCPKAPPSTVSQFSKEALRETLNEWPQTKQQIESQEKEKESGGAFGDGNSVLDEM